MTTGDAVASWYRHSIALPSSSRLVLLPSPPPPTPTNGPFEPASLSLSLYVHIHGGENTHANFLDVSPGPCPQDIPRDAREFTGEERSAEREREKESVRANSSVYSSSSTLPTPRRYIFPPWIEIYCSDGTHTKILWERASEKEGRSSVRISADSRSFSCLLSSHSPPSSRPTSVNRERGHKAYA